MFFFYSDQRAIIPKHVKQFYTGNTWGIILWYSVIANAKNRSEERLEVVEKYVKYLLEQREYAQNLRGLWYREHALIKLQQKDNETAVRLLLDALKNPEQGQELTDVDHAMLIDYLKSTAKKTIDCISAESKRDVELFIKNHERRVISQNPASISIMQRIEK